MAWVAILLALGAVAARGPWTRAEAQTPAGRAEPAPVMVLDIAGPIGVGAAHLLNEGLARARQEGAGLLVLRLDTPGGLVSVTREIIQAILAAPVPVAVYVAPAGARAASAGTYIAYAAHVAAMAPGTHLGAATPVQLGAPGLPGQPERPRESPRREGEGEDRGGSAPATSGAMERKVLNDAVAYLRALAQLRGRNADWAEKAVREAATLTAEEAARERVVDVLAPSLGALLDALDGRKMSLAGSERVLATRHARVIVVEPDWKLRLLGVLTDPNIAFILLLIGVYGIIFEFWTPGLTGPGVVGAISLIVALMALSALPLNLAGLALLALGMAMMAAEAFTPGFGILGLGGIVAFGLGGLFLFDPAGADIAFAVAWPVVLAAVATNALLFFGLLGLVMRVRRRPVASGPEEMIGLEGVVLDWAEGRGRVRVHGEAWAARAAAGLAPGARVRVLRRDGLVLDVAPVGEEGKG